MAGMNFQTHSSLVNGQVYLNPVVIVYWYPMNGNIQVTVQGVSELLQKAEQKEKTPCLFCQIVLEYWCLTIRRCSYMLKVIISVIFILICVALTVIVLLQEGKSAGLGSVGGMADTYWGKNKGRSMEGNLEKFTTFAAIAFMVLAIILNVL